MMSGSRLGRPGAAALVAVLFTAIAVAFVVAIPAELDRTSAIVLQDELTRAPIEVTGLQVVTVLDLASVDPELPFAATDLRGAEAPSMYTPATDVERWFELPGLNVREVNGERPPFGTTIVIRSHERLESLATTVEELARATDPDVIDIGLTPATAELMQVELGDQLRVTADTTDPLTSAYPTRLATAVLRVQRLVDLTPSDDAAWFGDDRMHEARQNDTPDGFEVDAVVAVLPDALTGSIWGQTEGSLIRRIDASPLVGPPPSIDQAAGWDAELARIDAANTGTPAVGAAVPTTQLGVVLREVFDGRREAMRVIGSLLVGAAALIAVAVVRLIRHAGLQRRRTIAVLRSRGASRAQLVGWSARWGANGGLVAGVLGLGAAQIVAAASGSATVGPGMALVVTCGAIVGLVLVAAASMGSLASRDLAEELDDAPTSPGAMQRIVDLVLVTVAAVGLVVIAGRGVDGRAFDTTAATIVAATMLSVGVIARRLLGTAIGWTSGGSLASHLARRHLGSGRSAGPMMVDVVAASVVLIALSAAVLRADQDQLVEASWEAASAPVRATAVLGVSFAETATEDGVFSDVDGVETVALEANIRSLLAVDGTTPGRTDIMAIDHAEAVALTVDDPVQPFGRVDLGVLERDGSIPVLVSIDGIGRGPLDVGTVIRSIGPTDPLRFTVVGTHRVRRLDSPTIVADREVLSAVLGRTLDTRTAWLNEGTNAAALLERTDVSRVVEQSTITDALAADPQRRVLRRSATTIVVLAIVVALVSTAFGVLLVVGQRRRQTSILSAIGAPRATTTRTVVAEIMVSFITALIIGAIGAIAATQLLTPALGPSSGASLPLATTPFALAIAALAGIGAILSTTVAGRALHDNARDLRLESQP